MSLKGFAEGEWRSRSSGEARAPRSLVGALLVAQLALFTPRLATAQSDAKLECAKAYELAQRTRKSGKLVEAMEQLRTCTAAACPAFVRDDCTRWRGEVEAATPKVVFVAKDDEGAPMDDARVLVDGATILARLDGAPHSLDPGAHVVRFEHASAAPIELQIALKEGETRTISVVFAARARPPIRDETTSDAAPSSSAREGPPAGVWVLGAIGVVGVAGFGVFALRGLSQKSDLDACKPKCDPTAVDDAKRTFVVGDVFLAVGVVSLASAAIVWASSGSGANEPSAHVGFRPMVGGGAAFLEGSF